MGKKFTTEMHQQELDDKFGDLAPTVKKYIKDSHTKNDYVCACGEPFRAVRQQLIKHSSSGSCGCRTHELKHTDRKPQSTKKTTASYQAEVTAKFPDLLVKDEYIDGRTKIDHICPQCGEPFPIMPQSVIGKNVFFAGVCRECSSLNRSMTTDEFDRRLLDRCGAQTVRVGPFTGTGKKVLVQCACGSEPRERFAAILIQERDVEHFGCNSCGANANFGEEWFKEKLKAAFGDGIRLLSPYTAIKKPHLLSFSCGHDDITGLEKLFLRQSLQTECSKCLGWTPYRHKPAAFYLNEAAPLDFWFFNFGVTIEVDDPMRRYKSHAHDMKCQTPLLWIYFDSWSEAWDFEYKIKEATRGKTLNGKAYGRGELLFGKSGGDNNHCGGEFLDPDKITYPELLEVIEEALATEWDTGDWC